jgi:hypothetical protein
MQVKDAEIFSLIETIGQHYRNNIGNRYLRRAFSALVLEPGTWNLIELLTEKAENYRYQGFHIDELYQQIVAIARFIFETRKDILPNIRHLAGPVSTDADKVYREMAINNFEANLRILSDYVNELYVKSVAIDKANAKGKPASYTRMPELAELGRYLVAEPQ